MKLTTFIKPWRKRCDHKKMFVFRIVANKVLQAKNWIYQIKQYNTIIRLLKTFWSRRPIKPDWEIFVRHYRNSESTNSAQGLSGMSLYAKLFILFLHFNLTYSRIDTLKKLFMCQHTCGVSLYKFIKAIDVW